MKRSEIGSLISRRRTKSVLLTILLFIAVSPFSLFGDDDPARGDEWLIGRGDGRLSGSRQVELPDEMTLRWRFPTGDAVRGTPVVRDGRVYAGSLDGRLYVLDLIDGSLVASFDVGAGIEGSPLLVESSVLFGTEEGAVFSVDIGILGGDGPGTGSTDAVVIEIGDEAERSSNTVPKEHGLLWRSSIGGRIAGGLNLVRSGESRFLVFGGYDAALHALHLESGEELWASTAGNYINGTPAVLGARILYGSCDSRIHFLSAADGSRLGETDLGSYIPGSPAIWSDTVYALTYAGVIAAVDADTMQMRWSWDSGGEAHFFSSPAVNEHRVVAGSREGGIYCLVRTTGDLAWHTWLGGGADGAPVIAGGTVVVGSDDGRIYLLRLSNGREIWSYETGGGISAAPAVVSGVVLIGSDDGYLYAFGAEE